jgi:fumarate hydratase class II
MIAALGLIKRCAALVNYEMGLLDEARKVLIIRAALEVEQGALDEHFVVDIFQTGSGTSSNMNANEVIANRAMELGEGAVNIHPNDHVNMSQSSNDIIPTCIHVALAKELRASLIPALGVLKTSLERKSAEFAAIVKTGRTHLQDATPITLGQEFSGYCQQVENGILRIERSLPVILELPLGGTAVGTGINTPEKFSPRVIAEIAKDTGLEFVEAPNHFEAQAAKDGLVEMSGQLKTIACSLAKVANDLRWMGSGPRCGLGELFLPDLQPGSSIMPGKVNPVIPESVLMVCAQVVGNDAVVTYGGYSGGIFELNVMMPVMAQNILQASLLLANSSRNLAEQCIDGIQPNRERLAKLSELSIAICTALVPKIGYDRSAELAKEAFISGKTLREIAYEKNILPREEIDEVLDLMRMTKPGL